MKQRGLSCIGTIKKNKEIPPDFLPKKNRAVISSLRHQKSEKPELENSIDISTVNAYVCITPIKEISKLKANFLKKFALQLVKLHIQRRSCNLSVRRKLRLTIFEMLCDDQIGNISQTRVKCLKKGKIVHFIYDKRKEGELMFVRHAKAPFV